MEVFAALTFIIVHAHFVEYLPREVQAECSLAPVQLREHFAFAAVSAYLLVARLPKPYLLEDPDEQLVDVVLYPTRRLDEFTLP